MEPKEKIQSPEVGLTPAEGFSTEEIDLSSGEVRETLNELPSEQSSGATSSQGTQDDGQSTNAQAKDLAQSERELLKLKLLKTAPKEGAMQAQIKEVLQKEERKLTQEVQNLKGTKNYHLLSEAVRKLREVVKEIGQIARLSLEALKDMWLRVVHNFA